MAGVGNEAETREKIHDFVTSWDFREFFLCVDPSICRNMDRTDENAYPEEMLLLYGIRGGKRYDLQTFRTADLTPVMQEIRKNTVCLVFSPLYYRDRSLGYVAMDLTSGTGSALYPVLMLLNGALMSLYLQTNLKRSSAIIERMAVEDIMTGMLNRRGYMERAPGILDLARREGKVFALLSADIDNMKDINDQFGHLMGDEAICRMGKALRCLEKYNMTPVHISGDEFIAYGIPGNADDAGHLVQYVNEALNRSHETDPWICRVSASMGVYASIPGAEDNIDYFMKMADRSMYAEKNRSRNNRKQ